MATGRKTFSQLHGLVHLQETSVKTGGFVVE